MKRTLLFICIACLIIGWLSANAQPAPFAPKAKTSIRTGFMPATMQPVPFLPGKTIMRGKGAATFTPKPLSIPALKVIRGSFGERRTGEHGQVIYLSGEVPGASLADHAGDHAAVDAAYTFLEAVKNDLRVKNVRNEFSLLKQMEDETGMVHIKMQQEYMGIPVYYGQVWLHAIDGKIGLFNGNPYPTPSTAITTARIDASVAAATAFSDVTGKSVLQEFTPSQQEMLQHNGPVTVMVFYHKDRDPRQEYLAWHVTLRPNFIERWEYFIDAVTGKVIHCYNNTHTDGDVTASGPDLNGVNRTIHAYLQAGTYYMMDISKPMYNPQNQEGTMRTYDANYSSPSVPGFNPAIATSSNNSWSPKVISSQFNAGVTYEYFRTTHSKNSWNNQGGSILSVINATEDNGTGMDNAYWNGVCIVYGNGNTHFKPLAGALDVSAHELGHAYDEASANLEYQYQSGAMNEAFSDIAGAVVERQNWKIGEDVAKTTYFPTGCLRDMSNPHNGGSSLSDPGYQPAHVNEMYTGSQDNGGVHINSGIINFAFYKYATAVGMDKGEKTFFRALFNYLTRSSQFIDCRLAVVQSAKDLYGDGSAEVNAARTAFDEVGITDGSGGNYQNPLPVNPGQDYILCYNTDLFDVNTLYISNTSATNFTPISQTVLANKPSITDDGSVAVFIGNDKRMHAIDLSSPYDEWVLQNEPIWSNVAVSKDGTMIAAVTEYQDSAIYIYSFAKAEWVKAHLYNPTTQQGVVTNNVLYADALEWDYSGEFVMYDAYNQMNSQSTGQNVDYWDISFIHVWDQNTSDWGTGQIFKLVNGLPEGVSIGNPSLSKNSPSVCAFDYFDDESGDVTILAANLETGDFVEVFANGTQLGYPNYSKLDDKILFSATYQFLPVIAYIEMLPDKIHPASTTAWVMINQAKWGVWYATGERPLAVTEPGKDLLVRVYPNPAISRVFIDFGEPVTGEVFVDLFDLQGKKIHSSSYTSMARLDLDLSGFSAGLYLLKVYSRDFEVTRKVLLR